MTTAPPGPGAADLPELARLLREGLTPARLEAVRALERIGSPEAAAVLQEGLREALREGLLTVARAIARALGDLRAAASAGDLAEALASRDPGVRQAAARALVRIGGAAVPALLAVIQDEGRPWPARREALWALVEIRGPEAMAALEVLAQTEHSVIRDVAAWAAGRKA